MKTERIRRWVDSTAAGRGDLDFLDLHVDEIDPAFENRESWIDAAIESLRIALLHRNSRDLPFTIAVGFSLSPTELRKTTSELALNDLQREVDDSPPSLYLFARNEEPWTNDDDLVSVVCALGDSWSSNLHVTALMREWHEDEEDHFRRSFWLAG